MGSHVVPNTGDFLPIGSADLSMFLKDNQQSLGYSLIETGQMTMSHDKFTRAPHYDDADTTMLSCEAPAKTR